MVLDFGGGRERHVTHTASGAQNVSLALVLSMPHPKPKSSSGGGSVLRSLEVEVQGGHGSRWGKSRAFSALENTPPRGSPGSGDRKRVK